MIRMMIVAAALLGGAMGGLGLTGGQADAREQPFTQDVVSDGTSYCTETWTWNFVKQVFVYQLSCSDGTTVTQALPMGW